MKKMSIVWIIMIPVLSVGLSSSSLLAEDFSFIGIKWSDDLSTVREKIKESGLASDARWMILKIESTPLSSIMKESIIDEEKSAELTHVAETFTKDLRIQHQLKYIEFHGKSDAIVKNGTFFFAYDRDVLLAYNLSLSTSIEKVSKLNIGGEFYQDLVNKYGDPTKTLEHHSKVWSRDDQSLYYTPLTEAIIVTYISEVNLSSYIDRLEGKRKESKEPEQMYQQRRPGSIQLIDPLKRSP